MKKLLVAIAVSGALTAQAGDLSYDAVVVGSGGAGLSAAVMLNELGNNVIVLEKMPMLGGNTVRAEGGMNAAGTPQQKRDGIPDTPEQHFKDTMKGGHNINDPELVRTMTENAAGALAWLIDLGADLDVVGRAGGAKYKRAHRPTTGGPVGPEIEKTLLKAAKDRKIEIRNRALVTDLVQDKNGAVVGVKYKDREGKIITIDSKAVVLATGGFGANNAMVTKFNPKLEGYATTNHKGATGDGIVLAEKVGASFTDLDQIQAHPTATPTGILISESVRGDGAILINADGKRFTNELLTRDVVSANELKQPGKFAWILWDDAIRAKAKLMDGYIKMGLAVTADNLDDMAKQMNVPADAFKATVAKYNADQKTGKDTAFDRPDMPNAIVKAPFFAVKVQPAVHHTMGGVHINTKAEVIGTNGKAIPGLFAAGEVTGGVHGGNRLGANAQCDIVTFGRIAGQSASAYIKK